MLATCTFSISHASNVYFLNITLADITFLNVTHIVSSQFLCLLAKFDCNIIAIKNITHDIITNLNITPIIYIIFRYHIVD